jgi:hypothetical protein
VTVNAESVLKVPLVAGMCRTGERWAVVDLAAKRVIAGSKEVRRA